jgi:hypothetical protein
MGFSPSKKKHFPCQLYPKKLVFPYLLTQSLGLKTQVGQFTQKPTYSIIGKCLYEKDASNVAQGSPFALLISTRNIMEAKLRFKSAEMASENQTYKLARAQTDWWFFIIWCYVGNQAVIQYR